MAAAANCSNLELAEIQKGKMWKDMGWSYSAKFAKCQHLAALCGKF